MWSFVEVGEGDNKRWSKMPLQTNGRPASSTNPETWADFLTVEDAYNSGKFSGIGFVFSKDDDLVGIDLDDCFDHQSESFINAALQQFHINIDQQGLTYANQ